MRLANNASAAVAVQGSRTIRTEEAVLVSLGFLQSAIRAAAQG